MSKVIVITSGKGGVGKSSISVNLAYALCDKDYRVCLIDADFGLKNLDVMLGLENRTLYDMQDIIEGKCTIEQSKINVLKTYLYYLLVNLYKSIKSIVIFIRILLM